MEIINVYENHTFDDLLQGFFQFIEWADELFVLALILIVADLFFGVKAAKVRGEKVRRSKAVKRTLNKICSYLLWIMVSFSFGEVFGVPFKIDLLPTIMILIIYAIEVESIYSNFFEWRGIKAKINLLKFFSKKTDIIEIEKEEEQNNG